MRNGDTTAPMNRRRFLLCSVGGLAGGAILYAAGQSAPRRISVKAAKFEFVPSEISVMKGRPVTLVLHTQDFPHGFNIPDFKVRRDLIPGREVELTFTPDKAGRFRFLCDNFCGEGHDQMGGWLNVSEP